MPLKHDSSTHKGKQNGALLTSGRNHNRVQNPVCRYLKITYFCSPVVRRGSNCPMV